MTTTTRESNKLTTQEAQERLAAAIRTLTSEDRWTELLRMRAIQHGYTISNILLAWSQNRDMKLPLGGAKNFWGPMERYPMKGTKALRILAPMIGKKKDDNGKERTYVFGFKAVPVFSLDQTDGKALPDVQEFISTDLGVAPEGLLDAVLAHATQEGLTVKHEDLPEGMGGYLRRKDNLIVLANGIEGQKQVSTLLHELAHWHDRENLDDYSIGGRPLAEVVAEATAYVTAYAAGMDVAGYSTGYVASWGADDGDAVKALKKVAGRIDKSAGPLLRVIDGWKATRIASLVA